MKLVSILMFLCSKSWQGYQQAWCSVSLYTPLKYIYYRKLFISTPAALVGVFLS